MKLPVVEMIADVIPDNQYTITLYLLLNCKTAAVLISVFFYLQYTNIFMRKHSKQPVYG